MEMDNSISTCPISNTNKNGKKNKYGSAGAKF